MMSINKSFTGAFCAITALIISPALALPIPVTIDFSTEDDFSTILIHGQIVDPAFDAADTEFGNLLNVSSTQDGSGGHLGVTVFNSDLSGTADPDLEVGTGNILILQNDDSPGTANDTPEGLRYTDPNDERSLDDNGSIVFDFLLPVEPTSLTIVDANGGFGALVRLLDTGGKTRTYTIPEEWTFDISSNPTEDGFAPLDLTSLAPQIGERVNTTSAVEDVGFNPMAVIQLKFSLTGANGGTSGSTSGGIDTLKFNIPEPTTAALVLMGAFVTMPWMRRRVA